MLKIDNLQTNFLKSTSFSLNTGDLLTISGISGSGKSLFLRAIADLDPNQGNIYLQGINRSEIPAPIWRKKVSYLPTDSAWWFETVEPHIEHWNKHYLSILNFDEDVLQWSISRLSSGEKQRLAIVRLLSQNPLALLLDEPTANLDQNNIDRVESLITQYQNQQQCVVLWVSHSKAQCLRIATQQATVEAGQLKWI